LKSSATWTTFGKNGTSSGSGLGIFHAKKVVEELGGSIIFESSKQIRRLGGLDFEINTLLRFYFQNIQLLIGLLKN
jgi:signal transduction histidine kinase